MFSRALSFGRRLLRGRPGHEMATDADILAAYRFFLGRQPNPDGYRHWQWRVRNGLTLEHLINLFTTSAEYLERQASRQDGSTVVDLGGYQVSVRASDPDVGAGVIATGDYEPHVRRELSTLLKPGQTVLDIGANVGCITFLAAKLVGPLGRVVAVEPNPDNLQALYAGIDLNDARHVRVLPYAASERPGLLRLTGAVSNTHVVATGGAQTGGNYVQAVALDEELAALPDLHLIKIDIEGHEPHAIKGMSGLIQRHRPILLTEFNTLCLRQHGGVEPLAYLEQLFELYPRLRVLSPLVASQTFERADAVLQYWSTTNDDLIRRGLAAPDTFYFDLLCTNS